MKSEKNYFVKCDFTIIMDHKQSFLKRTKYVMFLTKIDDLQKDVVE